MKLVNNYRHLAKRIFDLCLVIPTLLVLTPLLAFIALLVKVKLGSPIFFRQRRSGWQGQPFTIYKFRTLTNARDGQGRLLPDANRLTRLGCFLRQTSLDELPELFNILKGDMSLVGPRPLLVSYLNRYDLEQMRRIEAKPGLTGWAQIHGRNALNWEERFRLDIWYVDHWSLKLDILIILMTAWKVIKMEGINHPDHVTMAEFKGSSQNGVYHSTLTNPGSKNGASPQGGELTLLEIQTFTPELKAQIVLEVISGVKSTVEACREYGLKPYVLARWQADFLQNAAKAFQNQETGK
jgi:lipopolysaccharide/colanic/teichoic acid biosynthesis glycosyltransferase